MKEREWFIDIFDFVDSHSTIVGFAQFLSWNDLQQLQEHFAISEIGK